MAWIGITYLAVCYAALAFLLYACREQRNSLRSLLEAAAKTSLARVTLLAAVWILVFLLVGPLLPLLGAHCIWIGWRESRFWKGFAKQHRDALMDPIAFNQMQPAGRTFVTQNEEAIEALGFQPHNTYLYKPDPLLIEARYYLSSNGRTILSIGHIGGEEYYSLTSFLSGGSGVETGVNNHPSDTDEINATHYYYAQMFALADTEVDAAYAKHQAYLDRLSQDTGQEIVAMRRDQLVPAVRYANRRFAATKHLLGELATDPPATEWPFENDVAVAVEV